MFFTYDNLFIYKKFDLTSPYYRVNLIDKLSNKIHPVVVLTTPNELRSVTQLVTFEILPLSYFI